MKIELITGTIGLIVGFLLRELIDWFGRITEKVGEKE